MPQDPKQKPKAFDPDAYLSKFDPDAYLQKMGVAEEEPSFGDKAKRVFTDPLNKMIEGGIQATFPKYPTSPIAGRLNQAVGVAQMSSWPITLASEAVKSMPPWMRAIPGLTFAPEAVGVAENVLGAIGDFTGGLTGDAIRLLEPRLGVGATQELSAPAEELGSMAGQALATAGATKGLRLFPKATGATFRKITPAPEAVYARGGGLGYLDPLDRRAASRGVQERIELGGGYRDLPKRFEKIQADKSAIFEKQINPEIAKMSDAGLSVSTVEIANRAFADLQKRFPDLKAPDAARFRAELEKLKQGFIENNPETLSPKQMQEMKTAVHQRAPMDEMSGLRNEFNKTVAYELRSALEKWNPRLKPLHRRWAELNRLSEVMEDIGQKEGRSSASPLSSAPFYMTVGEPVRGAVLAEARNIARSPRIRSKVAFMLDYLQHIGNPRTPEVLPPPFEISRADITRQLPPGSPKLPQFASPADIQISGAPPYVHYGVTKQTPLLPPGRTRFAPAQNPPFESQMRVSTGNIGDIIPPSARSQIIKQLGGPEKQSRFGPLRSISDRDLITLAKEAGLYENAPLSEAPVSRGGSMDVRGPANQEQIRRFRR